MEHVIILKSNLIELVNWLIIEALSNTALKPVMVVNYAVLLIYTLIHYVPGYIYIHTHSN